MNHMGHVTKFLLKFCNNFYQFEILGNSIKGTKVLSKIFQITKKLKNFCVCYYTIFLKYKHTLVPFI